MNIYPQISHAYLPNQCRSSATLVWRWHLRKKGYADSYSAKFMCMGIVDLCLRLIQCLGCMQSYLSCLTSLACRWFSRTVYSLKSIDLFLSSELWCNTQRSANVKRLTRNNSISRVMLFSWMNLHSVAYYYLCILNDFAIVSEIHWTLMAGMNYKEWFFFFFVAEILSTDYLIETDGEFYTIVHLEKMWTWEFESWSIF